MKKLIFGIVFILCSAIPSVVMVTSLVSNFAKDTPFKAPAQVKIHADTPACYIWNVMNTTFEGTAYNSSPELPSGVTISMTAADGKAVQMQPNAALAINIGNEKKKSVGFFLIPGAGTYSLQVSGLKEPRIFAYSVPNFAGMAGKIIAMIALTLVFFVTGVILVILGIITLVRQSGKRTTAPAA